MRRHDDHLPSRRAARWLERNERVIHYTLMWASITAVVLIATVGLHHAVSYP